MYNQYIGPIRWIGAALPAVLLGSAAAAQQPQPPCTVICTPTIAFNVAENRSHVFGGPTVRNDSTGAISQVPSTTSLELQFFVSARTQVPRLSAFIAATWLPTAKTRVNPFTEYSANQLGEDKIAANHVVLTMGGLVDIVPKKMTSGYVALDGYVADLLSPAARPDDRSAYTHKLDVGGVALVYPFAGADSASAARKSGIYGFVNLDYVATGLPRAGDEVPKGRTFLTAAKPAALIVGLGLPIAPLLAAH